MSELARSAEWLVRGLADHVWQSMLVALGAALLAFAFRRYRADVRAAIWLVASLKFLVPFVAIAAVGRLLPWPQVREVAPPAAVAAVQAISQPFAPLRWETSAVTTADAEQGAPSLVPLVILGVWAGGCVWFLTVLLVRLLRSRMAMRDARPIVAGREVEALGRVTRRLAWRPGDQAALRTWRLTTQAALRTLEIRSAGTRVSPCVIGIRRPRLIWPAGLSDRLTNTQLDAVMAHELCHVRRRDNLAALGQTLVQALFWFHPLAWWLGARWSHERERACDEHVLARGDDPELYADGVLKVGEFCVGETVLEHAGIAGSRLTERMEAIMNQRTPRALGAGGRAALALACGVVFTAPVIFGGRTLASPPVIRESVPALPNAVGAVEQTTAPPAVVPRVVTGDAAGISGVVTDPSGAFVPGATVIVSAIGKTTPERTAVSDAAGRFSIGDLPVGDYDVKIQLPGFRTLMQRARVDTAQSSVIRAELAMGSVAETVTIRGAAIAEAPPAVLEGEWQEKLNRDPANATVYFDLAKIYYRHERFVESEALVEQGIRLLGLGVTDQPVAGARSDQVAGTIRVGGSIKEPRKISDVRPVYPATARTGNVSGIVVLEGTIGRDGTVRNLRVLRGVPELDRAAIGAARLWLFTPTLLNGLPIEVGMTITMNFEAPR